MRQRLLKRTLDVALTIPILTLTFFPLCLVALWVLAVAGRPVFFTQRRVGLLENPFNVYKVRTMEIGADAHSLGPVTIADDPRLIRGGAIVRRYKLDELPQLLNVLEGTMSLVGPRPTVAEDYARMSRDQRRRALVLPGVTGLAQVRGGAGLKWPERIRLDLEYIDNWTLLVDLRLLLSTVALVISGRAEIHPSGASEW